jgi:hypothetical protein
MRLPTSYQGHSLVVSSTPTCFDVSVEGLAHGRPTIYAMNGDGSVAANLASLLN